jgi:hypothetical protein
MIFCFLEIVGDRKTGARPSNMPENALFSDIRVVQRAELLLLEPFLQLSVPPCECSIFNASFRATIEGVKLHYLSHATKNLLASTVVPLWLCGCNSG